MWFWPPYYLRHTIAELDREEAEAMIWYYQDWSRRQIEEFEKPTPEPIYKRFFPELK